MSETTKVEQKKEEQKTFMAEEFAKEYQSLCEKTGWRVVVSPSWVGTNHGSFEMVLQYTVGKMSGKT